MSRTLTSLAALALTAGCVDAYNQAVTPVYRLQADVAQGFCEAVGYQPGTPEMRECIADRINSSGGN